MDGITEGQVRAAKLWETVERKNTALVHVLKQACSRNKAVEKQQLWEQKEREDHGSATSVSLKGRDGSVRTVARVPVGAQVTDNSTNRYAEERAKNADKKEDVQLERFCDGNDVAWRPDTFFTEVCGEDEVPPWPIRPNELFTNPHIIMKIMAQQMEKKKQRRLEKKAQKAEKAEGKKQKGVKKKKREAKKAEKRKGKKGKKSKDKKAGEKKDKGGKGRKAKKRKRKGSDSESSEPESSASDGRGAPKRARSSSSAAVARASPGAAADQESDADGAASSSPSASSDSSE